MTTFPTDEAERLAREYRNTAPTDVLHLWCRDAAAALRSLSAERDAQERTIAGMNEAHAKLVEDWSALRTQRDALAAECARLREALTRALPVLHQAYLWHRAAQSHALEVVGAYEAHDAARAALGARAS